jgi:phosphoribosylcarboxyaminoimidazole (NCAIR) mutase
VAEEAAIAMEVFGSRVERLTTWASRVSIACSPTSMSSAGRAAWWPWRAWKGPPSVVAGLVDAPVIAVPTSVGYGTSFRGITALFAMLNSCASGISVVNIDNGFGAAYQADMINKLAVQGRKESSR